MSFSVRIRIWLFLLLPFAACQQSYGISRNVIAKHLFVYLFEIRVIKVEIFSMLRWYSTAGDGGDG